MRAVSNSCKNTRCPYVQVAKAFPNPGNNLDLEETILDEEAPLPTDSPARGRPFVNGNPGRKPGSKIDQR